MKKPKLIIIILILVIAVLAGLVIYLLAIKPAISGYIVKNQITGYNKGVEDAVITIMQQAATCQQVPLIFGNQTMNMVWVECFQQPQFQG